MANAGTESHRAKRTEAMPKTSLFGSALEMMDDESAQSARGIDPSTMNLPKTPTGKGAGLRFVLPEDAKRQLPGAAVLEESRRQFVTQRQLLKQQDGDLRRREEESLYNHSRAHIPAQAGNKDTVTPRPSWFSEADLKGAKEINQLGLNPNQSYNRDKYGRKPPVHNYSLIGDVFRPGMDLKDRSAIQLRNQGYGSGDVRGSLLGPGIVNAGGACPSTNRPEARNVGPLDVPANIRHQIGSRECERLMADEAKVNRALAKQQAFKDGHTPGGSTDDKASKPVGHPYTVPKFSSVGKNPEYNMLSNCLRMNVWPGYSIDDKVSSTQTDYNDQVYLYREPVPDKWRYRKDHLSKWAEHNIIRQKMAKLWEAHYIETLAKKQKS